MNARAARIVRRASPGGKAEYRRNKRSYNKVARPQRAALKAALAT